MDATSFKTEEDKLQCFVTNIPRAKQSRESIHLSPFLKINHLSKKDSNI